LRQRPPQMASHMFPAREKLSQIFWPWRRFAFSQCSLVINTNMPQFRQFCHKREDRLVCSELCWWLSATPKNHWFQTTDLECNRHDGDRLVPRHVRVGGCWRPLGRVLLSSSFSVGQETSSEETFLLCWRPQFSFWHRPCSVLLPVIHCEQPRRTTGTGNSSRRCLAADAEKNRVKQKRIT